MAARNHSVTSGPHEKSDPLGRSLDKYEPDVTTDLRFVKKIYTTRFSGQKFYALKLRKL